MDLHLQNKNRARRVSYMFGYPHLMLLVLGTDDECREVTMDFRTDALCFKNLKHEDSPNRLQQLYIQRSYFQTISCQQLLAGLEECHYNPGKKFKDHVDARFSTVTTSQGVEDLNNNMKNSKQNTPWGSRYRRPQTGLSIVLKDKVLETKHKYSPMKQEAHPHAAEVLLRSDLAPLGEGSLPFKCVEEGGQTSPYFSPAAESVAQPLADARVLRQLIPVGLSRDLSKVWAGFVANSKHSIIFRLEGQCSKIAGVPSVQWHIGFHSYKDSGCLVWPVERLCDARCPFTYIKFMKVKRPVFLTLTNPDEIIAQSVVCKSWSWQKAQGANVEMRPALRFVCLDEPLPVLEVAAKAGFWSLPRNILDDIAEFKKVKMQGCVKLFEVLKTLVKEILKCSDLQALEILEKRCSSTETNQVCYEQILACDEAEQCLEQEDRDELKKEKNKSR